MMATAPSLPVGDAIAHAAQGWSLPTPRAAFHSPPLNLKRVAWNALAVIALLLINKVGAPGAVAFFLILAVMVIKSPRAAFQAIAICFLGLMLNSSYVPKTIPWTFGRLVIPLLALVRFALDLGRVKAGLLSRFWYKTFLFYVGAMAVCSIVSGWYTEIALLKLFNFWSVVTAVLAGVAVLRRTRVDLTEWFVSLIAASVLLGLMSIPLGVSNNFSRGTLRLSNIFVGAFLHPNCHTLYGAMFVTFLATTSVMGKYRNTWLTLPLMAIWTGFMMRSEARTSVLATLFGLFILLVAAAPGRNHFGSRRQLNLSRSTILTVSAIAIVALTVFDRFMGGPLASSVVEFLNKGGRAIGEGAFDPEKLLSSRITLMQLSWDNFRQNPVCGIGFQVAKTEDFIRTATIFSAPAEKGFLPTAVLEEGGFVGATTFIVFLLTFLAALRAERNTAGVVGFTTFLATNLGEVSIFSPGGPGAFGWVMVGAAMMLGDHCWTPQRSANTAPASSGAPLHG